MMSRVQVGRGWSTIARPGGDPEAAAEADEGDALVEPADGRSAGSEQWHGGQGPARLRSAAHERVETFKFSTDPELVAEVTDVVGLYLAPPENAARDTFLVRREGVQAAIEDDSLEGWPMLYRLGVANGLLFTPEELPTITTPNLLQALQICEPVRDAPAELSDVLNQVSATWSAARHSRGGDNYHVALRTSHNAKTSSRT
jgi:hypothetical protein